MRPGYASQFETGVLIIGNEDLEQDVPLDEDDVIETARHYEAVKIDEEDGGELFVVRFPDRFDEVYTEDALRRGVRALNKSRAS